MVRTRSIVMAGRSIGATAFKAECLKIMDEVARTGESVTITKRGRPVAELRPVRGKSKSLFGAMKGSVIYEDMVRPLEVEWEAMK
jgi:prevent-host-death family protein